TPSAISAGNQFALAIGDVSAPGPPTIGTATLSGATASVSFTPPANNGGRAITSYTATCTSENGGITRTGSSSTSPASVPTLTPGKTYTCNVTATNAVGTGAASAASNAVTVADLPGTPTIGTVTLSGATASVPFTAPESNGGSAITSYTATCT